jgi:hypothetical protein
MLNNRKSFANASVSVGVLLVGVSLFSVTASAQFRPNFGGNDVVIYADPDFRGVSAVLRGDTPDLRQYNLNDKVSSIQIPAGQAWEVCQDVNFGSTCQILRGSIADLRNNGWNDRISSLRRVDGNFRNGGSRNGGYPGGFGNPDYRNGGGGGVYSRPQVSQGLVFYDRTGYRGAAYDQSAIFNRTARSVEVRAGTWQLCDRTGRCATISESVSDLARLGLNGQITSVRPVYNNQGAVQRRNPRNRSYGEPRDGNDEDPQDRNYGR